MTSPYWLPPTSVPVLCGLEEHVLRWANGELTALHHDDIDGEMALGALGGEQPGCPHIVQAWRAAVHDPRVFTLASRGRSDSLVGGSPGGVTNFGLFARGSMRRARAMRGSPAAVAGVSMLMSAQPAPFPAALPAGGGMAYAGPAAGYSTLWGGPEPGEADPLVSLLHVPGLRDRLIYCAAVGWTARFAAGTVSDEALPTLTAALISRVRCAVKDWLGNPKTEIEVTMLPPAARPTLAIEADGALRVGVPFEWLAHVWGTELTTIYGRLTLAAETVGRTVTLDTVGPDLTRAPIVIRLP
jgi:hypothetical protein